ncbi:MAG: tetratricopeptide repeat protein [Burkholderiales bacterium]
MRLRATIRAIGAAFLLCVLAPAPAAAAFPGEQHFNAARAAFNAGDFAAALQRFLQARHSGLDTPGLRFNLGATYYRLHRYAEARAEFEALARDPQWAPLAHYNLGLTSMRLGDTEGGRAHFDQAHRTSADTNLRTLAGVALERLGRATLPPRSGTVVSLAGGYDSNPALYTDNTVAGSRTGGDTFVEALGASTRNLSGNAALGWNAHGAFVLRKYLDQGEFDVQGLRIGISRDTDTGAAQFSVGGNHGIVYFDGQLLEQAAALEVQGRTRLQGGRDLRASYELASIDGGSHYRYLDGWQQRLSAGVGFAWQRALWRTGYQLDIEDRRDPGYSPRRHRLFAIAELPDVAGWKTEARAEYRASRYHDAQARRDDRYGLALRASRDAGAGRRAFVDYSYYRNESSIDDYDYRRSQLMLGLEIALEKSR